MSEKAGRRIRTDDLLITNQLLYQLSYAGDKEKVKSVTALKGKHWEAIVALSRILAYTAAQTRR